MKRNIVEAAVKGSAIRKERQALDISAAEVMDIWASCKDNGTDAIIDAIVQAYSAGLAIGVRNQ